jgi:hypothetical protein
MSLSFEYLVKIGKSDQSSPPYGLAKVAVLREYNFLPDDWFLNLETIIPFRKNAKFAKNSRYEFTGTEKEDHQAN